MYKTALSPQHRIASTLCVAVFGFLCLSGEAQAQDLNYSDCAYIEFEDVDPSTLTLQERIAREEAILFASLDESAKCMEQALESSSDNLAEAAASGGQAGADGMGTSGAGVNGQADSESLDNTAKNTPVNSSDSAAASKTHQRGNSGQGSSAVCDAVKEGLASATTEAEKEHFKGLMADYGCQ